MSLDPLKTTQNIRESYVRYLTSTFRLKDATLRRLFQEEAERFWFINGPILEATPPYKKGCYLKDLIEEGLIEKDFENFIYDVLPYLRFNPLYLHQEKAIRKILNGRNVVITSGTASGKTECFLIPIYNHLLREYKEGKLTPGVYVLLLYPMNALANDQLKRLRDIAKVMEEKLPDVNITFGRYVGDTPETKKQGEEQFRLRNLGIEPVKSELLSREEMRENPPHILITNYAMLEYLLIRPKDSPFFDGEYASHWKFLVLDEAHIYTGAAGIEMAMLIRRLKDRVCENMEGDLQCIATSATLVKEENDFEKVAEFATKLFGEKFEWDPLNGNRQDIIKGEKIKSRIEEPTISCLPSLYTDLNRIIREKGENFQLERCYKLLKEYNIPENILDVAKKSCDGNVKKLLYKILSKDEKVLELKRTLEEGSKNLEECIKKLLRKENPSEEEKQHVIDLVNVAVWARPDKDSLPLLPARYHLFVRAPEGVFVSFYPQPKIFLERREFTEDGYPVFDLASCRRCGQEYLVGDIKNGKLKHSFAEVDTSKKNRFFLLWREEFQLDEDEDQEVAVPEEIAEKGKIWKLCIKCGSIWDAIPICSCSQESYNIRTLIEITTKNNILNICYLCGLRSIDIVREFIFQQDAPASVLATALYHNLEKKSAKEKKVLCFSDSRQDAAFFAPYLEFTYKRILFRRLIMEALQRNSRLTDYRLNSLCEDVLQLAEERYIFDIDIDRKEKKKEVWKWILQDFCGVWERRNSLEGVGLISFMPITSNDWEPIEELRKFPWNLSKEEAIALYQTLLNTLRFNIAITFPDDGPTPQDEFFAPRNKEYMFRGEVSNITRGIYSFIPSPGRLNARLEFLKKLYKRLIGKNDENEECRKLLGKIWEDISKNWVGKGIYQFSNSRDGILYQVDYRYWKIIQEDERQPWFICDRCGTISSISVKGVCPTFNCNGNLEQIDLKKRGEILKNHYRYLYTKIYPIKMISHEHTAQLTTDYASQVQERFINGEVNVLSCSTTFELGVDLGELETIFLRNVPPEPSNYIQRAGRAGRRLDTIGFTLTFAQLRSHDLTYFKEPERLVEGRIKPPVFEIHNEKIISRHLYSVVLANFLRQFSDYFGSVESFFKLESGGVSGTEKIREYLDTKPETIFKSLNRVIPQNMLSIFDIENWGWIDNFTGSYGVLTIADEKIRNEFTDYKKYYTDKEKEWMNSTDQQKRNKLNRDMDWANRRIEEIKKKQLIDFLASNTVIPKYGFPVDVVELSILSHTPASKSIQLERDLRIAISEFAPGSKVVANGYVWESTGLMVVKNRTWPIYWYAICPKCNRFYIRVGTLENTPPSIHCEIHEDIPRREVHKFITPIFGFVTSKEYEPQKPGESRPKKEFTTRPYFFNYKEPEEKEFIISKFTIKCKYSSDGELAVVCKGRREGGFWICFTCGAAFSERHRGKHKTPYGIDCSSVLRGPLHLGHTFKTDVLSIFFEEHQLEKKEDSFWFSLLYAILEGASQALGIRRQDLDGCLYPSEEGIMLILFDNVPGGAGHVKRLMSEENFNDVLKSALARVKNCSCGPETSCYGCLRNYQNQFCHEHLKRGIILKFLEGNMESDG